MPPPPRPPPRTGDDLKSLVGLSRCLPKLVSPPPDRRRSDPLVTWATWHLSISFSVEMQIELLIQSENRLPPATPSPSVTCETRGELQQTCWQEIRKGRSRLNRSVRVVCANTHPLSGAKPASCWILWPVLVLWLVWQWATWLRFPCDSCCACGSHVSPPILREDQLSQAAKKQAVNENKCDGGASNSRRACSDYRPGPRKVTSNVHADVTPGRDASI